jgi:hypothetical protein
VQLLLAWIITVLRMPSTSNACRRARSYRRPSSIEHNHVVNSGRTGLWVSGVDGGSIRDNIIIGWDRHPELPFFGINAQTQAQLQQDFKQPLVVHNVQDVETRDNVTRQSTYTGSEDDLSSAQP